MGEVNWKSRTKDGKFLRSEWTVDHEDYRTLTWCEVQTERGKTIAILPEEGMGSAELEANAHLIAAAPTMLRALDAQHAWNLAESDGYGTDFDDRMELCNYAEWLIRKARAAAIGESFDEPYDGVPHLIVWPEAELRRAPEEQAAELVRSILEQAAKARGEQP